VAYMNADTSPKVGFRPYGQTDAFGASHFMCVPEQESDIPPDVGGDGLGVYYLNRPFDPWELYDDVHHTDGLSGLGQNHPFKPTAWKLHGLGALGTAVDPSTVSELVVNGGYDMGVVDNLIQMGATNEELLALPYPADSAEMSAAVASLMSQLGVTAPIAPAPVSTAGVPAGTELLYNVTWAAKTLTSQTPQDIAAAVASALSSKWGIKVVSSNASANFFANQPQFSMYVATTTDYGQPNDVKSIIDGEVYNAGRQVVSSSISIVAQSPNVQAATTQTLLQQLALAQAKGDTVTAQAILKTLASLGVQPSTTGTMEQWLMTNAKWLAIGAAALIAIGPITQGLFGGRRR
jgi:hypothetical protein